MHGRHLRNQSGEPGWQAAFGCRENQLHEEVRKGRLIATLATLTAKKKSRRIPRLVARSPLMGNGPLCKTQFLISALCLLIARLRHPGMSALRSLSRVTRTYRRPPISVAIDPT